MLYRKKVARVLWPLMDGHALPHASANQVPHRAVWVQIRKQPSRDFRHGILLAEVRRQPTQLSTRRTRARFLNRWAGLIRVGTIDTALAELGPENGVAVAALIKELALVGGHCLSCPELAMRACDCRGQFGHIRLAYHS
jgi:hypothetical protein